MGKPLPGHKRQFYQATLVNPITQKAYTGVGPSVGAAQAQAQVLAVHAGEHPPDLEELEVKSLVGSPPQTFAGNPNLPDP
jgi:hypothetical protein